MTETLTRKSIPNPTQFKLILLAIAAFMYVTFEIYPIGLITNIARDLHVSEGRIGLLISGYAIVAGIVTIPSIRIVRNISRKTALLISLTVLIIAEIITSTATNYSLMTLSRVTGALTHGMLWSLIAPIAASLVPSNKRGAATAIVLSGATTAIIVGGPATTALGTHLGWHLTASILTILTVITAIGIFVLLPKDEKNNPTVTDFPTFIDKSVIWKRVFSICFLTILFVLAHFISFTYFEIIVRAVTFHNDKTVTIFMALFGVMGALSTIFIGKYNDRYPVVCTISSVIIFVTGIAILTLAFRYPHTSIVYIILTIAIAAWGAGYAAIGPCYQLSIMRSADRQEDLASSIFITSYQIGIASGSAVGAILLEHSIYLIPIATLEIALIALITTVLWRKMLL